MSQIQFFRLVMKDGEDVYKVLYGTRRAALEEELKNSQSLNPNLKGIIVKKGIGLFANDIAMFMNNEYADIKNILFSTVVPEEVVAEITVAPMEETPVNESEEIVIIEDEPVKFEEVEPEIEPRSRRRHNRVDKED